jgi:hypothetical protein
MSRRVSRLSPGRLYCQPPALDPAGLLLNDGALRRPSRDMEGQSCVQVRSLAGQQCIATTIWLPITQDSLFKGVASRGCFDGEPYGWP